MATRLNIALPKMVRPAINAATKLGISMFKKLGPDITIFAMIPAPAAPDKIPHTSPITSLQMELTLPAFLINLTLLRLFSLIKNNSFFDIIY